MSQPSKPTEVDPDTLDGAARAVGDGAADLTAGLAELEATVTTDNPWGADEPGTVFGMAYVEVLNHALEVYASHVELLDVAAGNLGEWAARVRAQEEETAQMFTSLTRQLPG